jgi:tetratricopeptide (TPR) repeat protein
MRIFGLLLILLLAVTVYSQSATVSTDNASLRDTPSATGKVLDKLKKGSNVTVIEQNPQWFLVQTADYVGWIEAEAILLSGAPGEVTKDVLAPEVKAVADKAKQSPDDFDAQFRAGEAFYHLDRYDEAISYFKSANRLRPDDRKTIVNLGNAYFDADQYEEAEKWYAAALVKNADDVDVRTDFGLTFAFREPPDYDRAIQEFNLGLAVDPKHPQALQNLTIAYTKIGDAAKARSTLARLIMVNPQNPAITQLQRDISRIPTK